MLNRSILLVGVALTLLCGLRADAAGFVDGAAADLVLGQNSFSVDSFGVNQRKFAGPGAIAIDPTTGKVFVADTNNNRVLRFGSFASLTTFAPAEAVIGQVNFSGNASAGTQSTLFNPYGIFVDPLGRLWVADFSNNRVLMWEGASVVSNGAPADRVYGQPNFTTTSGDTTANKMSGPLGVSVDSADRLWVTEYGNSRVLRFDIISTKPNGAAANGVLGQPGFVTFGSGNAANQMNFPSSAILDASGRLWVSDYVNNRVLRFDNAATLPDGSPADAVLGQSAFGTSGPGVSASTMDAPSDARLAADGSLWVCDYGNGRLLRFANPANLPNGAAASTVLGKGNFTTNTGAASASSMLGPFGMALTPSGQILAADLAANRVLRFTPDSTPPSVAFTGKLPKKTSKAKLRVKGSASDPAGVSSVQVRVNNGGLATAAGTNAWSAQVRLKKGKNRIQIVATDSVGNTSPAITKTVRRE